MPQIKSDNYIFYGKFHWESPNGTYQAMKQLAIGLSKYKKGVYIVSPNNNFDESERELASEFGVTLISLKLKWYTPWRILKYIHLVKMIQPKVVHFQYVRYPSAVLVAWINRILRIKSIISLHDGYSDKFFEKGFLKKIVYYYILDSHIIRCVNAIHYVTSREKAQIERRFGISKRSFVIPNLYNWEYCQDRGARDITFGYIGRLDVRHKGLDYQIALIKKIIDEGYQVRFVLHGSANNFNRTEIIKLIGKHDANIMIGKPLYGENKKEFLGRVKVFMHASRWELFGYSIVEAINSGCRVVISDKCDLAGELRSMTGITVLQYNMDEDMKSLRELIPYLNESSMQETNAKAFIRDNYCATKLAPQYIKAYQEL